MKVLAPNSCNLLMQHNPDEEINMRCAGAKNAQGATHGDDPLQYTTCVLAHHVCMVRACTAFNALDWFTHQKCSTLNMPGHMNPRMQCIYCSKIADVMRDALKLQTAAGPTGPPLASRSKARLYCMFHVVAVHACLPPHKGCGPSNASCTCNFGAGPVAHSRNSSTLQRPAARCKVLEHCKSHCRHTLLSSS